MKRFENQVIIVTGASQGIGKGIAKLLAEEGANIMILNRSKEKGEAIVQEILSDGGKAEAYQVDMRNISDCENCVTSIYSKYGKIDALINNAALPGPNKKTHQYTEEEFDEIFDTVIKAPAMMTKFVIGYMMEARKGNIINIGSLYGHRANGSMSFYHSAKAALMMQTREDAINYGSYNIRVNTVSPGGVMTEAMEAHIPYMTEEGTREAWAAHCRSTNVLDIDPENPWGYPVDIANAVAFLISDEARTITGADLCVDLGAACR